MKLRELRKRKGMTQVQLAQVLGVAQSQISHYENGRTYPSVLTLVKLSELFGVSLDELVKGGDKKTE